MKFVSIREFRNQTAALREELAQDQEIILTAHGRPVALVTGLDPENLEEELRAIRRARALAALDRIRAQAKAQGTDALSMDEIEAMVAETRRTRPRDTAGER